MEPVCIGCDGTDEDCTCRRPPRTTDCDHRGKGRYWCGYCAPPLLDE